MSEIKQQTASQPLEETLKERVRSIKNRSERRNLVGLARQLGKLPTEKGRAALEVSASLASVSLRASREFLQSAPRAAKVFNAEDLRSWGEIGRKLTMADTELGVNFFAEGVREFRAVPESSRPLVFQICLRQLPLSSHIALETFRFAPKLAKQINDSRSLQAVLEVAFEIAKRSAKHSADFLKYTPQVVHITNTYNADTPLILREATELAAVFAIRAGGMATDFWQILPDAIKGVNAENALVLFYKSREFLDFGGSVALHFITSGGEVLRRVEASFQAWSELLKTVGATGNAILVSFVRMSPRFFRQMASVAKKHELNNLTLKVLELTNEIAQTDAESALACLRSSPNALRRVSLDQYENWVREGLKVDERGNSRFRRSYFALETRKSVDQLHDGDDGLPLEKVQTILRIYVEGLTGREVEIAPLSAMPQESRIGDGKTIYLPSIVAEFGDEEFDFRLYKVLSAHAAGQIEFGTHVRDTKELKAAFASLSTLYEADADQTDAFSLAGYIEDVQKGEKALSDEEFRRSQKAKLKKLPKNSDYHNILAIFPEVHLARRIFTTLENGRIDRRLRFAYRGLARDLDLMQKHLRELRPRIFDLPIDQVPFELLFQITLCGGALDDSRQFYGQIVSEMETVVADYLFGKDSNVGDTLMATSRIYTLFQNITPQQQPQPEENSESEEDNFDESASNAIETSQRAERLENDANKLNDARDLFNAWNNLDEDGEPDDVDGNEAWTNNEVPEQPLEAGELAFSYDEWDRELGDHRIGWCRVIEKNSKQGERSFVELTRSRYRGVISSIRYQFQLMKPENLTRINRELDGEDYDLNAVIDYFVDKKADGQQSERLYVKRLRKQRDVAVSFLLDQSSSTARTITRNPLQPYTNPGKRIIEIEKESLVLMSEALEAVGDAYAIHGFTSEGRRNVKFYNIKGFDEKYGENVERKIGGISFQNNTRLGAAIRHACAKLLRQEARTKLLVIMTDGRPYDHDYGDARYAREDVREALRDAKLNGITPFCVTIDRESEAELKDLYGDVGYTIIDDVLTLPERMPNIYRRLTS